MRVPGYNESMSTIKISYRFHFPDGRTRTHDVDIDHATGLLVADPNAAEHEWTALEHKKCAHCPLSSDEHKNCPVARNLSAAADDFKSERSYEKVTCEVVAAERTYRKQLHMQEGLFGLFGLIMATSPCPYFEFLRPMARFHLPFSNVRETTVRSVSFYLLRQYFVAKHGGKPDFQLTRLPNLYKDLEVVNLGMVGRIRSITTADADANSIVILDGFAKILAVSLNNGLSDLESMFTK